MTDRVAPSAPTSAEEATADPFRRLSEHAPVGIVESDLAGNLVTVNEAWREMRDNRSRQLNPGDGARSSSRGDRGRR